jgi:hypothetical protein
MSMVTNKLVSFTRSAMAESGRMDGNEFAWHCSLIDFISSWRGWLYSNLLFISSKLLYKTLCPENFAAFVETVMGNIWSRFN